MFCRTFSWIYELKVIIYTPILILYLGMVLGWLSKVFTPFDPAFDSYFSVCWPPMDATELPFPWSKRRAEEFPYSQDHSPTMVAAMDRGEPITACLFIFLRCVANDAPLTAYKGMF